MCNEGGQTIVISCGSTKREQIELFISLFSPYGHVHKRKPGKSGQIDVEAYLNMSFAFLLDLPDAIPTSVLADPEAFFAFLAGNIDAEGCIGIYNGRARFCLGSCDKNILHQTYFTLTKMDIKCPKPRITRPKGYVDKDGHKLHRDLWRLEIYRRDSLIKLFERIGPYLRHPKRIKDMKAAIRNIEERNARRRR
jgi:hypothetical protein